MGSLKRIKHISVPKKNSWKIRYKRKSYTEENGWLADSIWREKNGGKRKDEESWKGMGEQ
jgi:hypothetical protein